MLSQLFQVLLSAVSMGSTCSLCGASASSAFLSSYIITHERIAAPCVCFLTGKACMTMLLCGLSSALGRVIIDSVGKASDLNIYLTAQIFVLVVCVIMIARWIHSAWEGRRLCTGNCAHNQIQREPSGAVALLFSGVACGATPCTPLLLVLGQCVALSLPLSLISGAVFAVTGFLSPVIFWLVISRVLAGKLRQDVAQYLRWFQLGCYVLLMLVTVYTIVVYIC